MFRRVLAPKLGTFYAKFGGARHVLQRDILEGSVDILHAGEEIGCGQSAFGELGPVGATSHGGINRFKPRAPDGSFG